MPQLRMKLDRGRAELLEIDTIVALEEGTMTMRATRDLVVAFATDEKGNFLDEEEARRLVGRLKARDLKDVFGAVLAQAKELAVPPATSTG